MPWNSDDGGNQGPWGQPPRNQNNRPGGNRGPGGGGGLPPEFDEILQKGKDSLKGALPAGGGASWLIPLVLLGSYWLYNSFYQIQPDERGVVLRLGEYSRTVDPGLHFAAWPIEKIEKPNVGSVRKIEINDDGQMLTSDKNILKVHFTVFWRVTDPKNYLFNVAEQESLVRAVAQSAMREGVGQKEAQLVLTTGKAQIATQVMQTSQALLDEYQAGITVTNINLGEVSAPAEVADAFAEVNRADQNLKQLLNEAQQYRNQRLQAVEGEVAKMTEEASAYKSRVIAEAEGEAARFVSVYDQYKNAKDVTRQRIFLETMEDVLTKSNKILIEGGQGGSGVVPYLPLPEIQKKPVAAQN
jgi:modulator of FtsH protease HflK